MTQTRWWPLACTAVFLMAVPASRGEEASVTRRGPSPACPSQTECSCCSPTGCLIGAGTGSVIGSLVGQPGVGAILGAMVGSPVNSVQVRTKTVLAATKCSCDPSKACPDKCRKDACCCSPSAAEARIVRKLKKPISLNYRETPLRKVLEDLRQLISINLVLDEAAIREEGICLDCPVTFKADNLPLRSALNALLRQARLTCVVRDETLQVTTERGARGKLIQRTYAVGDLLPLLKTCDGSSGKERTEWASDQLIRLITSTIAPCSWCEVGGEGAIDWFPLGRALVVNQTADVHDGIEHLIDALRRLHSETCKATVSASGSCGNCPAPAACKGACSQGGKCCCDRDEDCSEACCPDDCHVSGASCITCLSLLVDAWGWWTPWSRCCVPDKLCQAECRQVSGPRTARPAPMPEPLPLPPGYGRSVPFYPPPMPHMVHPPMPCMMPYPIYPLAPMPPPMYAPQVCAVPPPPPCQDGMLLSWVGDLIEAVLDTVIPSAPPTASVRPVTWISRNPHEPFERVGIDFEGVPAPRPADVKAWKVQSTPGGVQIVGPGIESGTSDRVSLNQPDGCILLEGHVRLKYVKDGCQIEVSSDKVHIDMKQGQVHIDKGP